MNLASPCSSIQKRYHPSVDVIHPTNNRDLATFFHFPEDGLWRRMVEIATRTLSSATLSTKAMFFEVRSLPMLHPPWRTDTGRKRFASLGR